MAPRTTQSVRYLLTLLGLVALCGFVQGVVHALNAPRTDAAVSGDDPGRDPVPLAKPLAAGVLLDEARVRQIAREEADAALVRARPKKAVVKEEDAADDADSSPPAAKPAYPKPAEPAPVTPSPPAQPGPQ